MITTNIFSFKMLLNRITKWVNHPNKQSGHKSRAKEGKNGFRLPPKLRPSSGRILTISSLFWTLSAALNCHTTKPNYKLSCLRLPLPFLVTKQNDKTFTLYFLLSPCTLQNQPTFLLLFFLPKSQPFLFFFVWLLQPC